MSLTLNSQHVADALEKLPAQFRESTNLKALISSWVRQIQEIENQFALLVSIYSIDNATGSTLDLLGGIVGERRSGRTDDAYRIWIKARLAVIVSGGTREDIIEILRDITGGDSEVTITNNFPAKYDAEVTVLEPLVLALDRIEAFQQLGTLAGVGATLTVFNELRFQFDTTGQGFDEGLFGEVF